MGDTGELPHGGTVAEFRQLVALDAIRYSRKAMLMRGEITRGVADESYDRLALYNGIDKAAKYAWALVTILEWARRDDEMTGEKPYPGSATVIAHLTQEVLANGEPSDRSLIADIVEVTGSDNA